MRRKDKEVLDRQQIDRIIEKAEVCHLGLCRDGQPYVVPVSYGYDGTRLYVHTASEGTKIDYWTASPRICFEVEYDVQIIQSETVACNWGHSFYSVIGFGRIEEIKDTDQKVIALNQIMRHYSGRGWDFGSGMLAKTRIWAIIVEEISGKMSKDKPVL
jgi:uncharacterized protein